MINQNDNSKAIELINFIWINEKTKSYNRLNDVMRQCLNLAISSGLIFDKDDFSLIQSNYRGGYWLGVNSNGNGIGEMFYSTAISTNNISAVISYERYSNLKPFIIKNHRAHCGVRFIDDEYRYRVTGFNKQFSRINLVAYDILDVMETGSKKLFNFNNKEWLVFRNTIREF